MTPDHTYGVVYVNLAGLCVTCPMGRLSSTRHRCSREGDGAFPPTESGQMRDQNRVIPRRFQQGFPGIVLAATVLQLVAMQVASATSAGQFDDRRSERRVVVDLPAADATTRTDGDASVTVAAGGSLSHRAMLHRFTVALVDGAGQLLHSDIAWTATVFSSVTRGKGIARLASLVQLNSQERTVSVPSPLGYVMGVEDSVHIVATLAQGIADGRLRITIEYEPFEEQTGRLGVVPLRASEPIVRSEDASGAEAGGVTRTWEWTADVDGRLAAITGQPLGAASALVLQDAATGEVLWRTTLAGRTGDVSYAPSGHVVRPGFSVRAGGIYTLTATYSASAMTGTAGCVQAMVLPLGPPSR